MIIKKLALQNFRNIANAEIEFSDSVTVICGNNAEGKTNFLEGLWLFSGNKSFRAGHDSDLIRFGDENARLHLDFFKNNRDQYADLTVKNSRRHYSLNGVGLKSGNELMSDMNMILFLPTHLSLIKDGPSLRRDFLDTAISVIKPDYRNNLRIYNKILSERNALLKDITFHSELSDMLYIYDSQLSRVGSAIAKLRIKYLKKLADYAAEFYRGISGNREKLDLSYICSYSEDNFDAESMQKALSENRAVDIARAVTTAGPHLDDFSVCINGRSAKVFASQGQHRSAVLCFKLAEAEIQNDVFGERPVILLDDVMSELDRGRQEYLYECTKGSQILITYCEKNEAMLLSPSRLYEIDGGSITLLD